MSTTNDAVQEARSAEVEPTPGPWFHAYRQREDGMHAEEVFDADGQTIATAAWYRVKLSGGVTGTNREANARLIAAAPDLLTACRDLLSAFVTLEAAHDPCLPEHPVVTRARAAISRALNGEG